jgi:hypothetical protein
VVRKDRKGILIRGIQMIVVKMVVNLGVAIIVFLAFAQFFWILFTQNRTELISNLGLSLKSRFGTASAVFTCHKRHKTFSLVEIK